MIEYLLFPAAFLVLLGLLGVHFLLTGFSYGPHARRGMWWLALPAAAGCAAVSLMLPVRAHAVRLLLGLFTGSAVYVGAAILLVVRYRERKLAALVGDVGALRRRIHEGQREVDRLFWQLSAAARPRAWTPATRTSQVGDARGELVVSLRSWQQAGGPREASSRAAHLAEWRNEFRRCAPEDLAARARVLEAAREDAPEEQRGWLDARLALLWSVYGEHNAERRDATALRERWDAARREVTRLRQELGATIQQRAGLLQRRLPLD